MGKPLDDLLRLGKGRRIAEYWCKNYGAKATNFGATTRAWAGGTAKIIFEFVKHTNLPPVFRCQRNQETSRKMKEMQL